MSASHEKIWIKYEDAAFSVLLDSVFKSHFYWHVIIPPQPVKLDHGLAGRPSLSELVTCVIAGVLGSYLLCGSRHTVCSGMSLTVCVSIKLNYNTGYGCESTSL